MGSVSVSKWKRASVIPPQNYMLRLTEAERLEDEGNLAAVEIATRDSNGSAAPGP